MGSSLLASLALLPLEPSPPLLPPCKALGRRLDARRLGLGLDSCFLVLHLLRSCGHVVVALRDLGRDGRRDSLLPLSPAVTRVVSSSPTRYETEGTYQALADLDLTFSCRFAIFLSLFSSSLTFSPPALSPTFSHRSFSSTRSLCSGFRRSSLSLRPARMARAAFASLGRS